MKSFICYVDRQNDYLIKTMTMKFELLAPIKQFNISLLCPEHDIEVQALSVSYCTGEQLRTTQSDLFSE